MRASRRKALVMAMALAAAGAATAAPEVYIPLGAANKVQVIDAGTKRPTAVIENVSNAHGLAITPDRRYLVVGSFSEVPAGSEGAPLRPAAVSQAEHEKHHATPAASGSGTLFVSSRTEKRIWVLDQSTLALLGEIPIDGIGHQMAIMAR